jgi:hypothetical protein
MLCQEIIGAYSDIHNQKICVDKIKLFSKLKQTFLWILNRIMNDILCELPARRQMAESV